MTAQQLKSLAAKVARTFIAAFIAAFAANWSGALDLGAVKVAAAPAVVAAVNAVVLIAQQYLPVPGTPLDPQ